MPKWVKKLWEWVGHFATVQAILSTDFVRVALLPFLITAINGGLGWLGGIPLMYVFVGCVVIYAALMSGLLRGSQYLERKSPRDKLACVGAFFTVDLAPIAVPRYLLGNRHQRRATKSVAAPELSSSQIMAGVPRIMEKGQISVEIRNTALFPISIILQSADTEIEGDKPPRGQFPKSPTLLRPGHSVRMSDDPIDLDESKCRRVAGKMDFRIKYGLPGKETFEMHLEANLDIQMEDFGFVTAVVTQWLA